MKKNQNIPFEIKVSDKYCSKEEQLYYFVKLLKVLAEGKIEILEKKHNKNIEKIKEYQEGIYYLNIIEEILEKKFESH